MRIASFFAGLVVAVAGFASTARADTALVPIGPSAFDVFVGEAVSTMRLKAIDAGGNPVPGVTVGFGGNWCPLFYDQPTSATSDASGIITVPTWHAPGYAATCFIAVGIHNSGMYQASYTINVLPAPSDAPATASLAYFGTTLPGYHVNRGEQLYLRLALSTLGSSGQPVPRQPLNVTASCGAFAIPASITPSTSTLDMISDTSGVATLPPWFAPNADTSCEIVVRYSSSVSLKFTMAVGDGPAPMVATGITRYETPELIRVPAGGHYDGIRVKTVNAAGEGVGDQLLFAGTNYLGTDCGTLGGADGLNLRSDASGIAELPRFNAPAGPKTCRLGVNLVSGGAQVFFTIEIFAPPAPANHFEIVAGSFTTNMSPGATVSGIRLATVNESGARVPNQAVSFTSMLAHCGSFGGMTTLSASSDANGVVTLPAFTAPMAVTGCIVEAHIVGGPLNANGIALAFVTGDLNAPLTPSRLETIDHAGAYTVAATGVLENVEIAVIAANGYWVRNRVVTFNSVTGNCGSFGGANQAQATTDQGGVAVMPRWTPSGQVADCLISAESGAGLLYIQVRVTGTSPLGPSGAVTSASGRSPAGGTINLTIVGATSTCSLASANFIDPAVVLLQSPLPAVSYPHGFVDFRTENCGSGQSVTFSVEFPQALPPTAQWWKYGPTPDNRTPHWYVIASTVTANRITFAITDGGLGDDDLMVNGAISDLGMLGIPGGTMQDLWWSGAIENGWGMSIVQHRDVLFANIFAYDAQGVATWYVMPSGSWNTDHTVYTGALYLPKGSAFYAYDGSKFDIGASVGTMKLTFANANEATFDYTIDGVTGRKNITRILFGPHDAPTDKPLADLWWAGSAQNGWGIALLQQYSSLFALWFTYDANGKATWFVMPGGSWTAKDDYRGNIYKAVGPPWLGVQYDVSRHRTIESGTFRLRFGADAATFDYTLDGKTGSIPLSRIPF